MSCNMQLMKLIPIGVSIATVLAAVLARLFRVLATVSRHEENQRLGDDHREIESAETLYLRVADDPKPRSS